QLIKAVAGGECVLWAGAGLSAQAGFPARSAFASSLLQAASIDGWVPGPVAQKLQAACTRGNVEDAIDELVRESTSNRAQLRPFFRSTYARFAVPSRTHELLAKLAFPAAITTNYDGLLEQMLDRWLSNTVALGQQPSAKNFVLKLYGN